MDIKKILPVFFLVVFVFYLILSFSYPIVLWDTATFFTNARVFRYGVGFFEWSLAPGWSAMLAVYPAEIFGRMLSALFGVVGLISVYYLGKELFNEKVGIASAFLLAINPVYVFWSAGVYSDVPAFVFMVLAILSFIRSFKNPKWLYPFGIFMGAAFLTRYVMILVCIPLLLYLAHKRFSLLRRKEFWAAVVIFIALIIPWVMFNQQYTGDGFTSFKKGLESSVSLDSLTKPGYYYFLNFHIIYSVFIPFFIIGLIVSKKRKRFAFPLALFLVFLIILSFSAYKFPRHMIPSFAGFALISGYGLFWVVEYRRYFYSLIFILPLLLVPFYIYYNPFSAQAPEINDICVWVGDNIPDESMVMSPYWVYWNYCGQKSIRFYEDKERWRSGINNFSDYINSYRIGYAIVSDYEIWPPGVNTEYMDGLNNFEFMHREGKFTVFRYAGEHTGPERLLPLEFVFLGR